MREWKHGGCHCGSVRFRARRDWSTGLTCNCSMCGMKGFLHGIVERAEDFELLTGAEALGEYRFNTRTARHLFCRKCGISSYYVPRSHPQGYSVNLRCVERLDLDEVRLEDFDGAHWEQAIHRIKSPGAL